MSVRQPGSPTIRIAAPRWKTRGLETPIAWGVSVGRRRDGHEWRLDLLHHKLHLEAPPGEIGQFEISHGFNLLTVQRLEHREAWAWGGGAGLVIAHPENTVRGQVLDDRRGLFRSGFFVGGPTLAALGRYSADLRVGLAWIGEARVSASWVEVPVAGGHARVPNVALHASLGLGFPGEP